MKYAFVYGGIGGAIPILIISASLALNLSNHTTSVWFGYLVMLAALSLIFVGVKRYRDVECGGIIRFWRALGLGLAMALVAGLIYAAGWEIFIASTGYDFMADYSRSMVEAMRSEGASPAAIQAKLAELGQMAEWYKNPLIRIAMIFAEIFPVGLLVALVSAALLRNPRMLPAAR
ncbi:MAG TPA: DUF4199 domain-containing protein [Allosphingosinicella sp.]